VAEAALVKYQDPVAADKLTKIQKDLDETKVCIMLLLHCAGKLCNRWWHTLCDAGQPEN
jgi:hypothetical protein